MINSIWSISCEDTCWFFGNIHFILITFFKSLGFVLIFSVVTVILCSLDFVNFIKMIISTSCYAISAQTGNLSKFILINNSDPNCPYSLLTTNAIQIHGYQSVSYARLHLTTIIIYYYLWRITWDDFRS